MKKTTISTLALTLLIVGAVDGISNLPTIALFGAHMLFFFPVAALLFLWPTGATAAELSVHHCNDSGIYVWVNKAFGPRWAGLAVWLQWINTLVWFPTSLATLTGTLAYLINPALVHHPAFLVASGVSVFWSLTALNLFGVKKSTHFAAITTGFGMIIPVTLIIVLSLIWTSLGKPTALSLSWSHAIPPLNQVDSWTTLTSIMAAFLGMELAAVHVKRFNNAASVFPKALFYAIIVILLTMGIGAFCVATVIPAKQIVLVSGTIETFTHLLTGFHLHWASTLLGIMLVSGSLGAMVNWLISPANSLAQAASDHFIPASLAQENQYGVPYKILLLQGGIVTLVSLVFFVLPSVNGSYWLLLDMSTELYLLMYVLLFCSALVLLSKAPTISIIPFGKTGAIATCLIGLIGCALAIFVGFIPPSNINVGSHLHYVLLFLSGLLLLCLPALLLRHYQNKHAPTSANGV